MFIYFDARLKYYTGIPLLLSDDLFVYELQIVPLFLIFILQAVCTVWQRSARFQVFCSEPIYSRFTWMPYLHHLFLSVSKKIYFLVRSLGNKILGALDCHCNNLIYAYRCRRQALGRNVVGRISYLRISSSRGGHTILLVSKSSFSEFRCFISVIIQSLDQYYCNNVLMIGTYGF